MEVFGVTLGPHALGLAAGSVGCLAVIYGHDLTKQTDSRSFAALIGLSGTCMLGTKITMAVLVACMLALAVLHVRRSQGALASVRFFGIASVLLAAPLMPLVAHGWLHAHSPAGMVTASTFGGSFYDSQALDAYEGTRQLFAWNIIWKVDLAHWSLFQWALILAFLVRRRRDPVAWASGATLFAVQFLVLLVALPKELRHLGGVQCALAVAGSVPLWHWLFRSGTVPRRKVAALVLLILPWAGFVVYMSGTFWQVSLGLESPREFLSRYCAVFPDHDALDAKLPADAVVIIGRSKTDRAQYAYLARPPVFYSSRETVHHTRDAPAGRPTYLFYLSQQRKLGAPGPPPPDAWLPPGMQLGPVVYRNPRSRFFPLRVPRPSTDADWAHLEVFQLIAAAPTVGR